jgi:hypothetical protein
LQCGSASIQRIVIEDLPSIEHYAYLWRFNNKEERRNLFFMKLRVYKNILGEITGKRDYCSVNIVQ